MIKINIFRILFNKFKDKYRLVIYDDTTLSERLSFKLSRLNVFTVVGIFLIFFTALITILIAFTPLREFIPGYPDGNMRRNMMYNAIKVDSLEQHINLQNKYIVNIHNILSGKMPEEDISNSKTDSTVSIEHINFKKTKTDSLFCTEIEKEDISTFRPMSLTTVVDDFSKLHFFPPLKGIVTNKYNPSKNHFGVDIVAPINEPISAVLDGTVIFADWTLNTGYIIGIQHKNNLLSVYKHNSVLLKKIGNKVKAGEPIAIHGNSGELTTGPHLHFELWHNGLPLNPENYIVF